MPKVKKQKKTCSICLKKRQKNKMTCLQECKHYFCRSCITKWSRRQNTCPQCRKRFYKIGDREVVERNQEDEETHQRMIQYIKEISIDFICSPLFRHTLRIGCIANSLACQRMVTLIKIGIGQMDQMMFVGNMSQQNQNLFESAKNDIQQLYEYFN